MYVPSIEDKEFRCKVQAFLRHDETTREWDVKLNELGHLVQGWEYSYVLAPETPKDGCLTAWGAYEPKVPFMHRAILHVAHPVFRSFMRKAFKTSSTEIQARRLKMIEEILDEVDKVLKKQKYLAGESLSHVDITFSSLLAPMMPARLVWAPQSLYAKGRFTSFHGAMSRMVDIWPRPLSEWEQRLSQRPCAQHAIRLYEEFRSRQL